MNTSTFQINGGKSLKGTVVPQGSKNEALQVLCAVLLTDEKVKISNIPNIQDVNHLIKILINLGVKVEQHSKGDYTFQANNLCFKHIESQEFRKDCSLLRGSIMLLGPLLARYGKVYMPSPGGDKIGRRRLNTHFQGLQQLGANFKFDNNLLIYTVKAKKLLGTNILLEEASVTGTANILMAAILSTGITTLYNAACEPYLQQLCKMLNRMGAKISGIGSNLLTIEGVKNIKGTIHTILPDMIEIGSWIGVAAMTNSEITIKNVSWKNLGIIPHTFRRLGVTLNKVNYDDIHIPAQDYYKVQKLIDGSILTIADAPWPGFTPDLLSIILVVATQANGSVLIHQKMFESRLFFTDRLIDMGAQIILCDPHRATVIGLNHRTPLRATTMTSPDIRAGNALLIAALSAKGISYIHNIEQIDRGYENIDIRLQKLGADILRL